MRMRKGSPLEMVFGPNPFKGLFALLWVLGGLYLGRCTSTFSCSMVPTCIIMFSKLVTLKTCKLYRLIRFQPIKSKGSRLTRAREGICI